MKMEGEKRGTEDRARQIYSRFQARSSKDNEYQDWAGYRRELTDFVIRSTRPGASLLILGAGKCNDLDLKRLAAHCGTIILSDYRPEIAEDAFRRYGLDPEDRLQVEASDYVGITDEDYISYTGQLLAIMEKLARPEDEGGAEDGPGLEDLAGPDLTAMGDLLDQIYERNRNYRIDLGVESCDNAVIAGVHSQLNNSFRGIFQYVRKDTEDRIGKVRLAEELNKYIFQITRKRTADLVDRFNEAVFSIAGEGVIYGYEKNIIYTPEGASAPVIGTVDGARQAGEAIEGLTREGETGCIWPLSRRRGIKFEMDICYLKTRR